MPFFQYRARDSEGALVTGTLEAANAAELEDSLEKMGLIPIKVAFAGRLAAGRRLGGGLFKKKVTPQELILFSRQLATLFSAGVPLTRALGALERQSANPTFKEVIKDVREEVEGGSTFSSAVGKHSRVFGELYAYMIEAGEAGGILDMVLARLAQMLEKDAENRAKIKSATLYPKIVLGAIALAFVVIMNFVIPKFSQLYSSFKIELPLPTRMLIAASKVFTTYWWAGLGAAAVVFVLARLYLSTERGKVARDRLVLKVPIFGPLILKSILARFSRVLGSLYSSGLPILQSLDIVSRAVENRIIAADVKRIEDDVRAGHPLSRPMEESANFPPMVVQMVAVGEESGGLDDMLEKAAEYYEQEVDGTIRNLTTTLEPVLLAFIFFIVLFLALAIFLPMWDIVKVVRR